MISRVRGGKVTVMISRVRSEKVTTVISRVRLRGEKVPVMISRVRLMRKSLSWSVGLEVRKSLHAVISSVRGERSLLWSVELEMIQSLPWSVALEMRRSLPRSVELEMRKVTTAINRVKVRKYGALKEFDEPLSALHNEKVPLYRHREWKNMECYSLVLLAQRSPHYCEEDRSI